MRRVLLALAVATAVSRWSAEAGAPRTGGERVRPMTDTVALVGGTVWASPDAAPLADAVVLIRDGRISAVGPAGELEVPEGARTIDCSRATILAGFWNSHVHFFERKWANAAEAPAPELARQLEDMLTRYGFTSAFDTGSPFENTRALRARIESGEIPGPRIRSTGEALIARGATPPDLVFRVMGSMVFGAPEISEAAEAAAAAQRLLDAGVDAIKVHLQPPPPPQPGLSPDAIAAAVGAAHRAGRPAFVHPDTGADVAAALRAGVDVIAHTTPRSGAWGPEVLGRIHARAALTPTLTLWSRFLRHDRVSVQEQMVMTAIGQLRAWIGAGGTVLFGTDLGAVDYDPGEEYAAMTRAGMGFSDLLASLTVAPAERFGEADRLGRVAAGLRADLVVLDGDPSADLAALTEVRYTLRDGKVIYPPGG